MLLSGRWVGGGGGEVWERREKCAWRAWGGNEDVAVDCLDNTREWNSDLLRGCCLIVRGCWGDGARRPVSDRCCVPSFEHARRPCGARRRR